MSCGCGCGGDCAGMGVRASLSPQERASWGMSGVDGGECDKPLNFGVWPSDVDAFKARILPVGRSLDLDVKACASLSPEERASWTMFYDAFDKFARRETPWFGAYGEWVETCSYAHQLDAWQLKIQASCKTSPPSPDTIKGANAEPLKAVVWVAGAVIAVAAVVAFSRGASFLPTPKRRR